MALLLILMVLLASFDVLVQNAFAAVLPIVTVVSMLPVVVLVILTVRSRIQLRFLLIFAVLFAILFDTFKFFVYDFHSKDTCLRAKWICHSISYHAVMHDLIPVFTCDYSKEYSDGFPRSGEVCVPVGERGKGNSSCRVISTHAVSFTCKLILPNSSRAFKQNV